MNEKLPKGLILFQHATLRDALRAFEETGFQVVLLSSAKGQLTGVATEGDVRRALLAGHGLISPLLPHVNQNPVVGRVGMPRKELVALLSDRVHFLPVLDEQDIIRDILFYDRRVMIPVATPFIGEKELRYVTDAVLSGWISSQGEYIERFEDQFASFCGSTYAATVSNGTVALHLALSALGIGPGDEVIVPALTFVATASAVRHCHAAPVFVDIHKDNWNIDPEQIERAISPRTRAIIPVHLYGQPCQMDRIQEIAERHHLWVIEDAAEAHGALYHGKRVGSIGHIGCFSFYANKIITTGEGGMVVTNDRALNEKIRLLKNHGMNPKRKYWHDVVGYNYRMTNLQAAIGVAQLERWNQIIAAREHIKDFYDAHIDARLFEKTKPVPGAKPVCWLYTLLLKRAAGKDERDSLLEQLRACNVDSRPAFYPIPAMPPYYRESWKVDYPVARDVAERGFSLPSSDLDDEAMLRIVTSLNELAATIRGNSK